MVGDKGYLHLGVGYKVLSVTKSKLTTAMGDQRVGPLEAEEFEIQSIARSAHRGRGRQKHYWVRWKGYGSEYDGWIPTDELTHAPETGGREGEKG